MAAIGKARIMNKKGRTGRRRHYHKTTPSGGRTYGNAFGSGKRKMRRY